MTSILYHAFILCLALSCIIMGVENLVGKIVQSIYFAHSVVILSNGVDVPRIQLISERLLDLILESITNKNSNILKIFEGFILSDVSINSEYCMDIVQQLLFQLNSDRHCISIFFENSDLSSTLLTLTIAFFQGGDYIMRLKEELIGDSIAVGFPDAWKAAGNIPTDYNFKLICSSVAANPFSPFASLVLARWHLSNQVFESAKSFAEASYLSAATCIDLLDYIDRGSENIKLGLNKVSLLPQSNWEFLLESLNIWQTAIVEDVSNCFSVSKNLISPLDPDSIREELKKAETLNTHMATLLDSVIVLINNIELSSNSTHTDAHGDPSSRLVVRWRESIKDSRKNIFNCIQLLRTSASAASLDEAAGDLSYSADPRTFTDEFAAPWPMDWTGRMPDASLFATLDWTGGHRGDQEAKHMVNAMMGTGNKESEGDTPIDRRCSFGILGVWRVLDLLESLSSIRLRDKGFKQLHPLRSETAMVKSRVQLDLFFSGDVNAMVLCILCLWQGRGVLVKMSVRRDILMKRREAVLLGTAAGGAEGVKRDLEALRCLDFEQVKASAVDCMIGVTCQAVLSPEQRHSLDESVLGSFIACTSASRFKHAFPSIELPSTEGLITEPILNDEMYSAALNRKAQRMNKLFVSGIDIVSSKTIRQRLDFGESLDSWKESTETFEEENMDDDDEILKLMAVRRNLKEGRKPTEGHHLLSARLRMSRLFCSQRRLRRAEALRRVSAFDSVNKIPLERFPIQNEGEYLDNNDEDESLTTNNSDKGLTSTLSASSVWKGDLMRAMKRLESERRLIRQSVGGSFWSERDNLIKATAFLSEIAKSDDVASMFSLRERTKVTQLLDAHRTCQLHEGVAATCAAVHSSQALSDSYFPNFPGRRLVLHETKLNLLRVPYIPHSLAHVLVCRPHLLSVSQSPHALSQRQFWATTGLLAPSPSYFKESSGSLHLSKEMGLVPFESFENLSAAERRTCEQLRTLVRLGHSAAKNPHRRAELIDEGRYLMGLDPQNSSKEDSKTANLDGRLVTSNSDLFGLRRLFPSVPLHDVPTGKLAPFIEFTSFARMKDLWETLGVESLDTILQSFRDARIAFHVSLARYDRGELLREVVREVLCEPLEFEERWKALSSSRIANLTTSEAVSFAGYLPNPLIMRRWGFTLDTSKLSDPFLTFAAPLLRRMKQYDSLLQSVCMQQDSTSKNPSQQVDNQDVELSFIQATLNASGRPLHPHLPSPWAVSAPYLPLAPVDLPLELPDSTPSSLPVALPRHPQAFPFFDQYPLDAASSSVMHDDSVGGLLAAPSPQPSTLSDLYMESILHDVFDKYIEGIITTLQPPDGLDEILAVADMSLRTKLSSSALNSSNRMAANQMLFDNDVESDFIIENFRAASTMTPLIEVKVRTFLGNLKVATEAALTDSRSRRLFSWIRSNAINKSFNNQINTFNKAATSNYTKKNSKHTYQRKSNESSVFISGASSSASRMREHLSLLNSSKFSGSTSSDLRSSLTGNTLRTSSLPPPPLPPGLHDWLTAGSWPDFDSWALLLHGHRPPSLRTVIRFGLETPVDAARVASISRRRYDTVFALGSSASKIGLGSLFLLFEPLLRPECPHSSIVSSLIERSYRAQKGSSTAVSIPCGLWASSTVPSLSPLSPPTAVSVVWGSKLPSPKVMTLPIFDVESPPPPTIPPLTLPQPPPAPFKPLQPSSSSSAVSTTVPPSSRPYTARLRPQVNASSASTAVVSLPASRPQSSHPTARVPRMTSNNHHAPPRWETTVRDVARLLSPTSTPHVPRFDPDVPDPLQPQKPPPPGQQEHAWAIVRDEIARTRELPLISHDQTIMTRSANAPPEPHRPPALPSTREPDHHHRPITNSARLWPVPPPPETAAYRANHCFDETHVEPHRWKATQRQREKERIWAQKQKERQERIGILRRGAMLKQIVEMKLQAAQSTLANTSAALKAAQKVLSNPHLRDKFKPIGPFRPANSYLPWPPHLQRTRFATPPRFPEQTAHHAPEEDSEEHFVDDATFLTSLPVPRQVEHATPPLSALLSSRLHPAAPSPARPLSARVCGRPRSAIHSARHQKLLAIGDARTNKARPHTAICDRAPAVGAFRPSMKVDANIRILPSFSRSKLARMHLCALLDTSTFSQNLLAHQRHNLLLTPPFLSAFLGCEPSCEPLHSFAHLRTFAPPIRPSYKSESGVPERMAQGVQKGLQLTIDPADLPSVQQGACGFDTCLLVLEDPLNAWPVSLEGIGGSLMAMETSLLSRRAHYLIDKQHKFAAEMAANLKHEQFRLLSFKAPLKPMPPSTEPVERKAPLGEWTLPPPPAYPVSHVASLLVAPRSLLSSKEVTCRTWGGRDSSFRASLISSAVQMVLNDSQSVETAMRVWLHDRRRDAKEFAAAFPNPNDSEKAFGHALQSLATPVLGDSDESDSDADELHRSLITAQASQASRLLGIPMEDAYGPALAGVRRLLAGSDFICLCANSPACNLSSHLVTGGGVEPPIECKRCKVQYCSPACRDAHSAIHDSQCLDKYRVRKAVNTLLSCPPSQFARPIAVIVDSILAPRTPSPYLPVLPAAHHSHSTISIPQRMIDLLPGSTSVRNCSPNPLVLHSDRVAAASKWKSLGVAPPLENIFMKPQENLQRSRQRRIVLAETSVWPVMQGPDVLVRFLMRMIVRDSTLTTYVKWSRSIPDVKHPLFEVATEIVEALFAEVGDCRGQGAANALSFAESKRMQQHRSSVSFSVSDAATDGSILETNSTLPRQSHSSSPISPSQRNIMKQGDLGLSSRAESILNELRRFGLLRFHRGTLMHSLTKYMHAFCSASQFVRRIRGRDVCIHSIKVQEAILRGIQISFFGNQMIQDKIIEGNKLQLSLLGSSSGVPDEGNASKSKGKNLKNSSRISRSPMRTNQEQKSQIEEIKKSRQLIKELGLTSIVDSHYANTVRYLPFFKTSLTYILPRLVPLSGQCRLIDNSISQFEWDFERCAETIFFVFSSTNLAEAVVSILADRHFCSNSDLLLQFANFDHEDHQNEMLTSGYVKATKLLTMYIVEALGADEDSDCSILSFVKYDCIASHITTLVSQSFYSLQSACILAVGAIKAGLPIQASEIVLLKDLKRLDVN